MHAAALSHHGCSILFPAKSGSGKSTLAAYLLKRNWQYYTDELLLLNNRQEIQALPIGLGVKPGSYDVLEGLGYALNDLPAYQRPTGIFAKYLSISHSQIAAVQKPACIVIPSYQEGVEAELRALTIVECLVAIFEAGIHAKERLTTASLRFLLEFLEHTPSYKITFSNNEEANELLTRVVSKQGGHSPKS